VPIKVEETLGLGFSLCLAFSEDLAGIIDHADGRFLERHVQPYKVRHDLLRVNLQFWQSAASDTGQRYP
jgi:hypothetical protein